MRRSAFFVWSHNIMGFWGTMLRAFIFLSLETNGQVSLTWVNCTLSFLSWEIWKRNSQSSILNETTKNYQSQQTRSLEGDYYTKDTGFMMLNLRFAWLRAVFISPNKPSRLKRTIVSAGCCLLCIWLTSTAGEASEEAFWLLLVLVWL
jgi:hypothetical protein